MEIPWKWRGNNMEITWGSHGKHGNNMEIILKQRENTRKPHEIVEKSDGNDKGIT